MKLKRLISGLIAAAVAVSTAAFSSFSTFGADGVELSGSCGDNATWFINSDDTLVISGTGTVSSYKGWYDYSSSIKRIVVEEGITEISNNMFTYCVNVKEIVFPSSLEKLGHCLSSRMTNKLMDVWMFSKVIENKFSGNTGMYPDPGSGTKWHVYKDSTTEASFKEGLKYTDADLEYITESDSFPEVKNREPLVLAAETETSGPAGIKSSWSWNETTKTLTFSGSGEISIKNGFQKFASTVETVDMENSEITGICDTAFGRSDENNTYDALCPKLKNLKLPSTLESIGDYAFNKAPITMENFYLPEGVKTIGRMAFYKSNLSGSLVLPSSLEYVGQQAFSHTKISYVDIPEGVTFGGTVFASCNDLKEVTVPKGCTYSKNGEGNAARANKLFSNCTGLEKVIVEDGAALAESMFINCSALKDVYLLSKTSSISISGPNKDTANAMFEGTNDPIFHVYQGSTAENALKAAGYVAADNANIIYLADTTALDSAIAAAEAIDTAAYTEETVKILTDAIEAAKPILENIDAAQADVDAAAKTIEDAIAGLAPNVIKGNLNGTILVSDKDTETEMTVTAKAADGTETTVTATSMGTYVFEGLVEGDYTLTVSGGKYVKRTYEIIVAEGENTQDVELNPCGDVNGDGKITTADVGMANSHAKGVNLLEGYKFDCANVKADEAISTADVGMINSHAKSIKALW